MPVSKNVRNDIAHAKPQRLPPQEYGNRPEVRAAEQMIESINQRHNGNRTWQVDGDGIISNEGPSEPPVIDMAQLELEATRDRISDIRKIVGKLTYGEMIDLAEQLAATIPDGATMDREAFKFILPPTMHKWSTA